MSDRIISNFFTAAACWNYNHIFDCEQLSIQGDNPARFDKCKFPNLRTIFFDSSIDFQVFSKECEFTHSINLVFKESATFYVPLKLSIRSIVIERGIVKVIEQGETVTYTGPKYHVIKHDMTVVAKYGESTRYILDEYARIFDCKNIRFSMQNCDIVKFHFSSDVLENNNVLGTVKLTVVDDPFSYAVLTCDGSKLHYVGNVPNFWSQNAHINVTDKFSSIRKVDIKGAVGKRAFADMNFDMKKLSVSGRIHSQAFYQSDGEIGSLSMTCMDKNAFKQTEIEIKNLSPGHNLSKDAKITADTVYLENSDHISDNIIANTIVVTDIFAPVVTVPSCVSQLIFADVKSKGPFTINNLSDDGPITVSQPEHLYRIISRQIKVDSIHHGLDVVERKLMKRYGEVFDMSLDNSCIVVKDKDRIIARYYLNIDRKWNYLITGYFVGIFWALFCYFMNVLSR